MGFPVVIPAIGSQAVLGAYAKLKRDPVKYECPANYIPEVDVVIPAFGAAKRIPYALASLADQTYSNIGKLQLLMMGRRTGLQMLQAVWRRAWFGLRDHKEREIPRQDTFHKADCKKGKFRQIVRLR